jgi:hypothetical protein
MRPVATVPSLKVEVEWAVWVRRCIILIAQVNAIGSLRSPELVTILK